MKSVIKAITPAPLWDLAREVVTRFKSPRAGLGVTEYWTAHHVHSPVFGDGQVSRNFIDWRNKISLGYAELMPFQGHDGKVVVDYGCGPGIELTGLGLYSKPRLLYGVDVSSSALEKAGMRTRLHGIDCKLLLLSQETGTIPIESSSVDLVHCSGVLHHTPNPVAILKEFRRILVPQGTANVMVYNYESVYMHLYVAYMKRLLISRYRQLPKEEVFRISTDGPTCPISKAFKVDEFIDMARTAGFEARFKGAAMENGSEMKNLNLRWDAIADARLDPESRAFLYELTFDDRGRPVYRGNTAGCHACYELTRSH